MKNVVLVGYDKMGSAIVQGWMRKSLNFNFFVQNAKAYLTDLCPLFKNYTRMNLS